MDTSLKRIIAFIIDLCLVLVIADLVCKLDPYRDKYASLNKELLEVTKELNTGSSSYDLDYYKELNYKTYRNGAVSSGITIVTLVLYFGVLQYALKGQTPGKKLMKLKVVSNSDKSLNIGNYLLRVLILNNVWLMLINIICVFAFNSSVFYRVGSIIGLLSNTMYMVNLIMVMFRSDNRGLHDMLANTKVIDLNSVAIVSTVTDVKKESIKEKEQKINKKKSVKK